MKESKDREWLLHIRSFLIAGDRLSGRAIGVSAPRSQSGRRVPGGNRDRYLGPRRRRGKLLGFL